MDLPCLLVDIFPINGVFQLNYFVVELASQMRYFIKKTRKRIFQAEYFPRRLFIPSGFFI